MSIARSLAASRIWLHVPVALLCILACALVSSTYAVFGHTWDEPEHLAAGIALLDTGEYPYDQQHPPLARVAMAIGPYLAGARSHGNAGPSGEEEGRDILYDGHYDQYLTLARLGMLPFLVVALIATWLWTLRLFGTPQGIVAVALLATSPVIIGHAAVATLDIPMVGTTLLALYLLWSWFEQPTLKRAIVFGCAAGIAAGTKLSSIPFIGCATVVWFAAALWSRRSNRESTVSQTAPVTLFSLASLVQVLVAAVCATIAMLACYGFIVDHLLASFTTLLEHNHNGHLSYFMGELKRTGWWNFYVVALTVKTPLPLLLTGVVGSGWLLVGAFRAKSWLRAAPALAWLAMLIFASGYSHINIGVRHVLIILPLLAMNAAALIVALWRQFSSRFARLSLIALLGWQAWSMTSTHPDYLAYFNELAGEQPEKILIDSDLDWGQDLKRLKQALLERKITHFSFIYRGTSDLQREGFPAFEFLWPKQRATGWIAVTLLAKATGSEDGGYDWLNAYKPVTRVGKSIDLYYIETRDTGRETRQQ